jgi:hypothetical protein
MSGNSHEGGWGYTFPSGRFLDDLPLILVFDVDDPSPLITQFIGHDRFYAALDNNSNFTLFGKILNHRSAVVTVTSPL